MVSKECSKMLKDITDKLEPELKKAAATKSFKEQVLAKGYSEKRLDNKSGIFIKFGDKTYTLRSINGEQVLYDPINEKVVKQFNKDTDTFEDYLLKNPNYQVLSVEEYKDYSKAQKIAKYRQAEIEALKSLISRVTEKGKEAKEKIAEKQKELDKKIKEVEDLVNSINKETLTPEFREELQGLVKNLQENIDNLKSEIADLQATREDLLKYYDEYNTLKKQLEAEQDSYININKLIDEEQQNIANQAQLAINEVTKAIADSLEKLEYYEDYYQVIQDLILNDMILRDFISSMDFNAAFNTKYPGELRKKITPKFLNEYINTVTELNPNLSNAELDKINQVLDLIDKNPSYLDDLNSLLNQRAKLIELGQSIKFNEQNLEFTEKEIKRLKEQLPLLVAKREELLAKQGAKEFQSTIKLKALDEFKKIARRRIDAFEKLVPQELADQTTKNGLQTREPGSSLDKTKEQRERENMKKGTWSSTTGVVIQYKYNPATGRYEDVLGEDGLPLFTDSKSQLLWAKFLDDNSKELASGNYTLEFHLHDPNGTSALDKQITANIPADKIDVGNDIYAVIIDKAGKPVTVSGQYLFTGIHKVDTLFPENGSLRLIRENAVIGEKDPGLGNYLDGISPATAIKVKYQDKSKTIAEWQKEGIWDDVLAARKKEIFAQEKESFSNFREGIKARLNKGEKVTSEIKSVSDGIPYLDKTLKSAKSFIGDDFTLDYDTTGTFIATTKDGQKIPIEGGKLTDNDVNTVIEILKYAFPKGEDYFNGTIKLPKGKDGKQLTYQGEDFLDIFPTGSGKPSVLGSLIYYGRNKEGSKKFNIWGKGTSIQFVDEAGTTHIITRADLYKPTSQGYLDLQSFLGTKNLNFNRAFIKNGLYFQPIVKDGKLDFKIYKNYNEFVKEKAKTYLHKTTDEQPLFTNRYITYSTNTTEKPKQEPKKVVKAAPASTGGNTSIEDLAEQMAGDTDFMEAMNELKEGVVEGPMMDAGAFGLDAIISKKEEKKVETKEDDKVADIERRRQENDTLGKSILQKLGYKNENRLPNGNVKGGQAGWKIRFNIKNPKTGESYYVNETQDSKNNVFTITNPVTSKTFTFNNKKDFDTKRQEIYKEIDNSDYTKKAEILINFLLNYFGSNEKADSKNLQKHYVLEDKDGTRREPFKHLSGGEIGESDFTIYIGSADDVMKFISDIRTSNPEILKLLHTGNKSGDISIDDIFKGRIEGSKIGFSGYHAPTNLNKVTGSNDFTFNFNQNRVNINYNGNSLLDITIFVEGSNRGYKGVFDENLKNDFPELYKNIRNIVGFQLYGNYLQGSNNEFLKLTGTEEINAKYDAELKALDGKKPSKLNVTRKPKSTTGFTEFFEGGVGMAFYEDLFKALKGDTTSAVAKTEKNLISKLQTPFKEGKIESPEDIKTYLNKKDRVATLTNEDALKRLRELIQSGEVEKKCS